MLSRVIAAVLVAAAVSATASAQSMKLPEIEFGRYHALVIGNTDLKTASGPSIEVLAG